jgi:hypothetical protein
MRTNHLISSHLLQQINETNHFNVFQNRPQTNGTAIDIGNRLHPASESHP